MSKDQFLVINGWSIFAHPLFLQQLEEFKITVENLRIKYPQDYKKKNPTKILAAIIKFAFEVIPDDPTHQKYRQGNTLGEDYKHWFRAKFFQQYRLFFRYHQESKIIIFAWVNDSKSKRAYNSKKDAYEVFKKMLKSGYHPDNWNDLLQEAKNENNRLEKIIKTLP